MEPIDKFGTPIYPKTYSKMQDFGRVLKMHGYTESSRKPNLFFKHDGKAYFYGKLGQWTTSTFFADMRGTEMAPIWEDPSPLFYVQFTSDPPRWLRNRLAGEEFDELRICRDSNENLGEYYNLQGERGYCVLCGKDFKGEGTYCSPQCHEAYGDLDKVKCRVCGKTLDHTQTREHHLSYGEGKTILVCQSCHLKIHRGAKMPHLKPIDKKVRT